MVFRVDYVDAALLVHHQCPRIGELAGQPAGAAPHTFRDAGRGELLHSMIAALDDVQVALRSERQVIGVFQLPGAITFGTDSLHELPGLRANLNAVVARVGDVEQVVRSDGQGPDA